MARFNKLGLRVCPGSKHCLSSVTAASARIRSSSTPPSSSCDVRWLPAGGVAMVPIGYETLHGRPPQVSTASATSVRQHLRSAASLIGSKRQPAPCCTSQHRALEDALVGAGQDIAGEKRARLRQRRDALAEAGQHDGAGDREAGGAYCD